MSCTDRVVPVLLVCLVVSQLSSRHSAEAFKFETVKVGSEYQIECFHSVAAGVTPTGLEIWWYHKGEMVRVASIAKDKVKATGPIPNAKATGFQFSYTNVLNFRVERPTADDMGAFVCILNYLDENDKQRAAVADYVNFLPEK